MRKRLKRMEPLSRESDRKVSVLDFFDLYQTVASYQYHLLLSLVPHACSAEPHRVVIARCTAK